MVPLRATSASCLDVTDRKLAEESVADMSRKLIEAQEQERTWIARELHDDINQRIALVSVNLERLQGDSRFAPATTQRMMEIREQLSSLASDVAGSIASFTLFEAGVSGPRDSSREFSAKSYPRSARWRLSLTRRAFQSSYLGRSPFAFSAYCKKASRTPSSTAGQKHFEVRIKGTPNELELTVRDSGVGFDPDEAIRGRGLGLTSMKERLKLVHGRLSVESRLAQGTTIRAIVPFSSGSMAAGA